MGARHAIAAAGNAGGTRLLDEALEEEVGGLAGELAGEEEEDLGLAGGQEESSIDYYESLGDEGEVGAEVGDGICWILGVLLAWGQRLE